MKRLIALTILLALTQIWAVPSQALAGSTSFNISVTIPAIIGVNTPPFDSEMKLSKLNTSQKIATEEVWRNNKKVILRTITDE